jgi:hypothetical protein
VIGTNDNTGDVDFFDIDHTGRLVIGESNFGSTPSAESTFQTLQIADYTGSVTFGASTQSPAIAPTIDDDTATTDTRYSVYNRGQNRVYIFDLDSGATPGVIADVYVYDLTTNALVYQELNATNHFFRDANSIRAFTLGDFATTDGSATSQDGKVDAADIDALYARIADPTAGGRFSASVGQEMFDLDGDDVLTGGDPYTGSGVTDDTDYLVRRILGTEYGDADLNGLIDVDDFAAFDFGFEASQFGWANGDFDGNGIVDIDDLASSNSTSK